VGGLAIIGTNVDAVTTPKGLVLVLLAALCWAGANITVKYAARAHGRIEVLGFMIWSCIFAVPPLAALALWLEGFEPARTALVQAGWGASAAVLWQSLGDTLFGFGAWNWLLSSDQAAFSALRTCSGSFATAVSRALAGPVGLRRPCSQFSSVPLLTCSRRANCAWDSPVALRVSFTSTLFTTVTRPPRAFPFSWRAIHLTDCTSFANSFSSIAQFLVQRGDQAPELILGQVRLGILRIAVKQVNPVVCSAVEVDHPRPATLAATRKGDSQLAQAVADVSANHRIGLQHGQ
jgi:hypothetical protein